jgi:hypothetical protein
LFAFVLIAIDEEPKSVKEAIDSEKGRLWKDTMIEEMEFCIRMRRGIYSNYLVEEISLVASGYSRRR